LGAGGVPTSSVRYFPQRGEFPPRLPRWLDELSGTRQWTAPSAEDLSPAQRIDRVAEIAAKLIAEEQLGADDVPDLLSISVDVGSVWAAAPVPEETRPDSASTSAWRALDRLVATLLDGRPDSSGAGTDPLIADDRILLLVGVRGSVPPPPWESTTKREVIRGSSLAQDVERHLDRVIRPLDWVLATTPSGLWLHPRSILASGRPAAEVQALAAAVAETDPNVLEAIPATTAARAEPDRRSVLGLARRSLYRGRFPDVLVIPRPFVLWEDGGDNASPADRESPSPVSQSPHAYDTHVPLVVLRPGAGPRAVLRRVSLEDVALTLALLLRSDLPSGVAGEPLVEIGSP
jgi:hypothetical protein